MNKNQTCYLFFDLDGTVLKKGTLPDEHLQAMKSAQALGHKLILNTGRSRGNTLPIDAVFDVPWDGMVFGGGAEIRWKNEILYRQTVCREDCLAWLTYCLGKHRNITFGGSETRLLFDVKADPSLCSDENWDACVARLDTMLETDCITNLTVGGGVLPSDPPKTDMTVIQLPTYTDIFPPYCDKGMSVLRFCDMIDAPLAQCVCFGDSQNDLAMFRVCPTGICMDHAPKELIALSTYHAKTELGVAEGLQFLFGLDGTTAQTESSL